MADEIVPLQMLRERRAEAVQVRIEAGELDDETVESLRRALERHRGELTVYLEVVRPGAYQMLARAETAMRVAPSEELAASVERVLGPGRLRYRPKRSAAR